MKSISRISSETIMEEQDNGKRAICFLYHENVVEFSNEAFCTLTGLTRTEVHNLNLKDITHPDDFQDFMSKTQGNYLKIGISFKQRLLQKNKSYIWVERREFDFTNETGERIYKVVAFDVIEEKG